MTRWSKIWRVAAGVFTFINVAGAVWAAAEGEEMHMTLHIFLLLLTLAGYVGWRLARRAALQDHLPRAELAEQRIAYLQQSVDAMALELERVGEAQRFSDKLRVERGETPPLKKDQ
jgi:hypothetical protein